MRALVAPALLFVACGTATTDPPQRVERVIVDISGKVQPHPFEAEIRANDETYPAAPAFAGATLKIESALDAVAGKAPLKTGTVNADGTFAVTQVDVTDMQLALVGSLVDPTNAVIPSGYGLARQRPTAALVDKPVYVITRAFLDRLGAATSKGTPALTADDLLEEGFVLGRFTDAEGKGVAGVKLAKLSPTAKEVVTSVENPVYYLNADLSGVVEGATSASGLFLYLPPFGTAEYTGIATGTTFEKHLSGSRAGTGTITLFGPKYAID